MAIQIDLMRSCFGPGVGFFRSSTTLGSAPILEITTPFMMLIFVNGVLGSQMEKDKVRRMWLLGIDTARQQHLMKALLYSLNEIGRYSIRGNVQADRAF